MEWIKRSLTLDTSQKPARYVGAPTTLNDWLDLYKKNNITETLSLIERECRDLTPHRIIVLYVPSRDAAKLTSALDPVCFREPLDPEASGLSYDTNGIGWRHDRPLVKNVVSQALLRANKTTNALKAEITDRRISAFTLPALNFYYPDQDSQIAETYSEFARQGFAVEPLKKQLLPERFTRDELPNQAFKSKQHSDEFFQDCRGRVFPPDPHHAPSSFDANESPPNGLSLALRQRYRFGVTVRDGNVHYDVQFKYQRRLNKELMHCAADGDVWVTSSHANVGVNDVIWVPSGTKQPVTQ